MESQKQRDNVQNDQLSSMPDELLLSIMSTLTMKEVARTSVLSHRWRNLWGCFHILRFEDLESMEKIKGYWMGPQQQVKGSNDQLINQEKTTFVNWVNHVIDQHKGPTTIDEFRVTFDLNNDQQSDIDNWVDFALTKQAKNLVLEFNLASHVPRKVFPYLNPYSLPLDLLSQKLTAGMKLRRLKVLHLIWVNMTAEILELILHSSTCLKSLSISVSPSLTSIRAPGLSLSLEHLCVYNCSNLRKIDISAPKLLSFEHQGCSVELDIGSPPSLCTVSVGGFVAGESIAYVFEFHSICYSKLTYLQLNMRLLEEENLEIKDFPALTTLKHLTLDVYARRDQSVLGWIPLIEASPVLQKLTLKLCVRRQNHLGVEEDIVKRDGKPLKCLKTLELDPFEGCPLDVGLATHVFENAIKLQEVIASVEKSSVGARERAMELKNKIPHGVNLTIKE